MASLIGSRNQKVSELALEIFVLMLEASSKEKLKSREIAIQVTDWLTGGIFYIFFIEILKSYFRNTLTRASIFFWLFLTCFFPGKEKFFQDIVNHLNNFKQQIKEHKVNSQTPIKMALVQNNFTPPPELYLPPRVNHVFKALQLLSTSEASNMFKIFLISDTTWDIIRDTVHFLKVRIHEI
jgi:hypothetical protein